MFVSSYCGIYFHCYPNFITFPIESVLTVFCYILICHLVPKGKLLMLNTKHICYMHRKRPENTCIIFFQVSEKYKSTSKNAFTGLPSLGKPFSCEVTHQ